MYQDKINAYFDDPARRQQLVEAISRYILTKKVGKKKVNSSKIQERIKIVGIRIVKDASLPLLA